MDLPIDSILKTVQELGVPVSYLLFTCWLLLLERRRTEQSEARNQMLQDKLYELGKSQIEASLRTEQAVTALRENTGSFKIPPK